MFPIHAPESLKRSVLFAVELLDPVTQTIVFRGMKVTAEGLRNRPIVNRSGRFVWLREGPSRPSSITVEPGNEPYEVATASGPPLPDDLDTATESQRLVRISLRPTRAYRFPEGVTAVRGRLLRTLDRTASPVAGAEVRLRWFDDGAQRWVQAASVATTDRDGEFAVFVRLLPQPPVLPDIENGFLRVRLHFIRSGEARETPGEFEFLGPGLEPKGRVPEGQVLRRYLTLAWDELSRV